MSFENLYPTKQISGYAPENNRLVWYIKYQKLTKNNKIRQKSEYQETKYALKCCAFKNIAHIQNKQQY